MPATIEPTTASDKRTIGGHRLFWLTVVIAIVVVLVDQATKWWAEHALSEGKTLPVIGDFIRFQLVYNSGAALSIGTSVTWVFAILAAVAVVVITWFAWQVGSRWWMVSLGLLLGGAATHLGDRLFRAPGFARGHVVDFIAYANFFIGNFADIAIVLGVILILLLTLLGVRMTGKPLSTTNPEPALTTDAEPTLTTDPEPPPS